MRKQIKYNNGFYDGDVVGNDIKQGYGKYLWNDGSRYEGQWHNDKRNGNGKFIWPNGDLYEGDFFNGMQHGNGRIVYKNGKSFSGSFVNGNPTQPKIITQQKPAISSIHSNTAFINQNSTPSNQNSTSNSFSIITYLIIAIIAFVAFKTNPTTKDFIDYGIHEFTKNTEFKGNETLISMFSGELLKDNVKRTDFYVCSYYNLEIDNSILIDIHVKVQAIGIFGKIIIINLKN
jgi:hypothetical protein